MVSNGDENFNFFGARRKCTAFYTTRRFATAKPRVFFVEEAGRMIVGYVLDCYKCSISYSNSGAMVYIYDE